MSLPTLPLSPLVAGAPGYPAYVSQVYTKLLAILDNMSLSKPTFSTIATGQGDPAGDMTKAAAAINTIIEVLNAGTPSGPVGAPTITSFSPTTAVSGDSIVVTGTNLSSVTSALIGTVTVPAGYLSTNTATSVTLIVPPGGTSGQPVQVTTAGGTATSSATLTINASTSNLKAAIVNFGDSLTAGVGSSDQSTKSEAQQLFTSYLNQTKFKSPLVLGYPGAVMSQIVGVFNDNFLPNADALVADCGQIIFEINGGHNDLMYNPSTCVADVKAGKIQLINQCRQWAAGKNLPCKIILGSLTPNGHQYGSSSLADYETHRQQLNNEMLSSFKPVYGADYYVNWNADDRLNDVTDTTYYNSDQQHNTDAGYLARAQDAKPYFVAAQAGNAAAPLPDIVDVTTSAPVAGGAADKTRWFTSTNLVTHRGIILKSWECSADTGDKTVPDSTGAQYIENALTVGSVSYPAVRLNSVALTGSNVVPISGNQPYQFLAVIRAASAAFNNEANVLGLGGIYNGNGSMEDICLYNGKVILHVGGDNTDVAPAMLYDSSKFVLVGVRHDGSNGYSMINGMMSPAKPMPFGNSPAGPIKIGPGYYGYTSNGLTDGQIDVLEIIMDTFSDSRWNTNVADLKDKYALY